jgi:hypothetical protein
VTVSAEGLEGPRHVTLTLFRRAKRPARMSQSRVLACGRLSGHFFAFTDISNESYAILHVPDKSLMIFSMVS